MIFQGMVRALKQKLLIILIIVFMIILFQPLAISQTTYVIIGVEPGENSRSTQPSWAGTDMDIKNVSVSIEATQVSFRIGLASSFSGGPSDFRDWWQVFIDIDKDSNIIQTINDHNDFDWEYVVYLVHLVEINNYQCQILDSQQQQLQTTCNYQIIDGTNGAYIILTMPRSLSDGGTIPDSFYLLVRTAIRNQGDATPTTYDIAPRDDAVFSVSRTGDYYIFNSYTTTPTWTYTVADSDFSQIQYPSLDFTDLKATVSNGVVYIGLYIDPSKTYNWSSEGLVDKEYNVYFDIDNNVGTGYRVLDAQTEIPVAGAEYRVRFAPGFPPVLEQYDSNTASWLFVTRVDYLKPPADSNELILMVPSDLLGTGSAFIVGESNRTQVYPYSTPPEQIDIVYDPNHQPLPIPEPSLMVPLIVLAVVFIILYRFFYHSRSLPH